MSRRAGAARRTTCSARRPLRVGTTASALAMHPGTSIDTDVSDTGVKGASRRYAMGLRPTLDSGISDVGRLVIGSDARGVTWIDEVGASDLPADRHRIKPEVPNLSPIKGFKSPETTTSLHCHSDHHPAISALRTGRPKGARDSPGAVRRGSRVKGGVAERSGPLRLEGRAAT